MIKKSSCFLTQEGETIIKITRIEKDKNIVMKKINR